MANNRSSNFGIGSGPLGSGPIGPGQLSESANADRAREIAEQYQQSINEIERRRLTAESLATSSSSSQNVRRASNISSLESRFGYKFAVFNKAHRQLNPKCERPAIRLLGFFHGEGDFQNWMDTLADCGMMAVDADGSRRCKLGALHKAQLFTYALIPTTEGKDRDPQYISKKVEAIKSGHLEHIQYAKQEFTDNHTQHRQGSMGMSLEKKRERADKKQKKSTRNAALRQKAIENASSINSSNGNQQIREVSKVPRLLEISKQQCAIVVVLNDVTQERLSGKEDPEPAIMILDCFNSCEDAEKHIESVLKNSIVDFSMFVIDMYEWIFPEDVKLDEVREKYRIDEQNKLMQAKKTQKQELLDYEQKCKYGGYDTDGLQVITEEASAAAEIEKKTPALPLPLEL